MVSESVRKLHRDMQGVLRDVSELEEPHGFVGGTVYLQTDHGNTLMLRTEGAPDWQDKAASAKEERGKLQAVIVKAWQLLQDSGVMREPNGRTGNEQLDELVSLLDEHASGAIDG